MCLNFPRPHPRLPGTNVRRSGLRRERAWVVPAPPGAARGSDQRRKGRACRSRRSAGASARDAGMAGAGWHIGTPDRAGPTRAGPRTGPAVGLVLLVVLVVLAIVVASLGVGTAP